ncbi:chemotaxis protein CheB [Deinococcus altitudinis]|uniref:chemotaxis protein CheB n=1 Tax=Deinococcus altitudinis TaxID=468914 RepID=UPI0038913953
MLTHRLVVIGASAGGLRPLLALVAGLPADFPAAVCVVMHVPAHAPSHLPDILSRAGALPASHPADGEAVLPGRIFCARPDHHLLVEDGRFRVTRGPKENRVRPAVDALFRSAAYGEGPGVIGVVLSGLLDDGTSGLWAIKHFGGATVVQDPDDAEYDSMPRSALNQVEIDQSVPARDLPALLIRLTAEPAQQPQEVEVDEAARKRTAIEVGVASRAHAFQQGVMNIGKPSSQTCPECGGVLVEIKEGGFTRYRCHTGHAYTGDALLVGVTEAIEDKLWSTMRALEEASMLLDNTGEEYRKAGNLRLAQEYALRAREMDARSKLIFENLLQNRSLSAERLEHDARSGDS